MNPILISLLGDLPWAVLTGALLLLNHRLLTRDGHVIDKAIDQANKFFTPEQVHELMVVVGLVAADAARNTAVSLTEDDMKRIIDESMAKIEREKAEQAERQRFTAEYAPHAQGCQHAFDTTVLADRGRATAFARVKQAVVLVRETANTVTADGKPQVVAYDAYVLDHSLPSDLDWESITHVFVFAIADTARGPMGMTVASIGVGKMSLDDLKSINLDLLDREAVAAREAEEKRRIAAAINGVIESIVPQTPGHAVVLAFKTPDPDADNGFRVDYVACPAVRKLPIGDFDWAHLDMAYEVSFTFTGEAGSYAIDGIQLAWVIDTEELVRNQKDARDSEDVETAITAAINTSVGNIMVETPDHAIVLVFETNDADQPDSRVVSYVAYPNTRPLPRQGIDWENLDAAYKVEFSAFVQGEAQSYVVDHIDDIEELDTDDLFREAQSVESDDGDSSSGTDDADEPDDDTELVDVDGLDEVVNDDADGQAKATGTAANPVLLGGPTGEA